MKYLILLTSLFLSFSTIAQNWSLVMPNDTLVYEQQDNSQLFTVWVDSIEATALDTTYFINRISPGKYIKSADRYDTCSGTSNSDYYNWPVSIYEGNKPQFIGGSITKTGMKYIIHSPLKNITILAHNHIGQSWIGDSATSEIMKVIHEDTAFLESYQVVDSIKVLELENQQFIISKNHGIITSLNFGSLSTSGYVQIGVQNLNMGTIIPMWADYFDFDIGDVFVREYFSYDAPYISVYVRKVRIMTKNTINDTLVYSVQEVNSNRISYWKYWPKQIPFLNAMPNTIDSVGTLFLWPSSVPGTDFLASAKTYRNNSNQIVRQTAHIDVGLNSYAYCVDDSIMISYVSSFSIKYVAGLGVVSEQHSEGNNVNLVGYIKNGVAHGDTTSVKEINYANHIKVYPNPVSNQITIEIKELNGSKSVEIFDLRGQRVFEKRFMHQELIEVSYWPKGVYFMVIKDESENTVYRKKIVVN